MTLNDITAGQIAFKTVLGAVLTRLGQLYQALVSYEPGEMDVWEYVKDQLDLGRPPSLEVVDSLRFVGPYTITEPTDVTKTLSSAQSPMKAVVEADSLGSNYTRKGM